LKWAVSVAGWFATGLPSTFLHFGFPAAAVLFYDLFDLASFKLRSVAPAGASSSGSGGDSGATAAAGTAAAGGETSEGDEEAHWEAVAAVVEQLEEQLGPQEQFFR